MGGDEEIVRADRRAGTFEIGAKIAMYGAAKSARYLDNMRAVREFTALLTKLDFSERAASIVKLAKRDRRDREPASQTPEALSQSPWPVADEINANIGVQHMAGHQSGSRSSNVP